MNNPTRSIIVLDTAAGYFGGVSNAGQLQFTDELRHARMFGRTDVESIDAARQRLWDAGHAPHAFELVAHTTYLFEDEDTTFAELMDAADDGQVAADINIA